MGRVPSSKPDRATVITALEIIIAPAHADDQAELRRTASELLAIPVERISAVLVRKRSIDARRRPAVVRARVEIVIDEPAPVEELPAPHYPTVDGKRHAVIVGAGPAGLFAALRLIELGITPIVLERGKDVRARRRDLKAIQRDGIVNPESNYCFGEGGAGTYSDGKLYTRSTKRGNVEEVLRTLVAHGAAPEIMIDAHPHIGSNKLPYVVTAMRESILRAGGTIRFDTRVTDLLFSADGTTSGVRTVAGDEITGEGVILATGHSARDVFWMLQRQGVAIEAKPFAVGVRIEHPQPLIDRIQYHALERQPGLPAASYRLATTVRSRGVFSFCMCPGGFIVPSATAEDEVVVNGMSLSRRDSPFANSGMVVAVEPEDLAAFAGHGALAGVAFQRQMEVAAARAGGGMQRAPGQRMTDFIEGRGSSTLPDCSYNPGLTAVPLHQTLPSSIARRLQIGLREFGKSMRGYMTEEGVLIGVETRTSSPVRIPRDPATLEHPTAARLYPCAEGAGYAGGIVSAAIDGVRVAEALAQRTGVPPAR